MNPQDDFISIADFARAAGVSPQSIYPRLDKDLKEYCQLINGRKSLHRDALKLYEIKPPDNELTAVLKVLEKQLDAKDSQIEQLNNRIKELQEIIKASQQIEHEKNQLLLLEVQPVAAAQESEAPPATVKSRRWFNWFRKGDDKQ